jgi:hypothetical protein
MEAWAIGMANVERTTASAAPSRLAAVHLRNVRIETIDNDKPEDPVLKPDFIRCNDSPAVPSPSGESTEGNFKYWEFMGEYTGGEFVSCNEYLSIPNASQWIWYA